MTHTYCNVSTVEVSPLPRSRVLIVGAAGWNNVGDDLIADSLAQWVRRSGAVPRVVGGPYVRTGSRQLDMSGNLVDKLRVVAAVATSNYVLIGGGGLLDDRSPNFYRPFTRVAVLCRWLRRRYALVGIGVGPVQNKQSGSAYAVAANEADQVMVRDAASKQRLIDCGVTRHMDVIADPVVWAPAAARADVGYDLAVNLRNWHSMEYPQEGYEGPFDDDIVSAVAAGINAVYGPEARVALVSMSAIGRDDDALQLEKLRRRLKASTETHYSLSSEDVVRTISSSETVLSMRLHACLLGAAYRKRVVGLAYDPKVTAQGNLHRFATISLEEGSSVSDASIRDALLEASAADPNAVAPAPCWDRKRRYPHR